MRHCANCHKKNLWRKTPDTKLVDGQRVRIWQCRCGHRQSEEPLQIARVKPKILYFDVERAPGVAYYYDRKVRGGYISTDFLKDEPFIICWAAAWLDVGTEFQYVISAAVSCAESLAGAKGAGDRRILKELFKLLDCADYVVGHNVDGFDLRKINNRFIQLDMGLPYQFKTIDTLKLSRKYFPFESNGLDYISVKLGGRPKMEINFEDWKRIVETGDSLTLQKAENYCRGDVREGIGIFESMVKTIESSGRKIIR